MKKLLFLLIIPLLSFGQDVTYVPDDNFEQKLIYLGYDTVLDNYVLTSSIDTITSLIINWDWIDDLTGIEGFSALTILWCFGNQLTSLDVSQNRALIYLDCHNNQLTTLDVRKQNNTKFS